MLSTVYFTHETLKKVDKHKKDATPASDTSMYQQRKKFLTANKRKSNFTPSWTSKTHVYFIFPQRSTLPVSYTWNS